MPENLLNFVHILVEELIVAVVLDKSSEINRYIDLVPMRPGDVPITYADNSRINRDYGFKPSVNLREKLNKFAEWHKEYSVI